MKPHVRRGVECVVLLLLAGTVAHIDRAKAISASSSGSHGTWGTAYEAHVGRQTTSVGTTVRSFAPNHPDFRRAASGASTGRYAGIMSDLLGPDTKPVFSSTGFKVMSDWRDAAGNIIIKPRPYLATRAGDVNGQLEATPSLAVESASTFNQWFRDVANVNTSERASINFARDNGLVTFNGSLDNATGSLKTDYTAESEWYFIYEAGKNWYVDVGTNAEAWLYIDDKLVIDGGGVGAVNFTITNGTVTVREACDASVTIVGAAIQSGNTACPVTTRVQVGSTTLQPFGSYDSYTAGNVNSAGNPRTATLGSNLAAGTTISVTGRSWVPEHSRFGSYMAVDSASNSPNVRVFRNGDSAPDIRPFQNQASAKEYLSPYIDRNTHKVVLDQNQALYLFELGTTSLNSSAADFQDLVVLITLHRPAVTNTTTTTSATFSAGPETRQRIDLDRLTWLENRGSYRMKLLFANRTGSASNLRVESNITTMNLINTKSPVQMD